ncbi:MAG: branched-chain amino acid ABC transporter permease [Eubacteriales bacterium]|nr:branched-chain amino acid ABC transporter permease [Eubacteriales bacterium]
MKQSNANGKSRKLTTVIGIGLLLVFVILLENLSTFFPGAPQVLQPTSPLFTVLKKGAVYSLVAVTMNLLNGFTGLFSLGQAGFMLLGAYTYAILTVPAAQKDQVYYLFGGCAFQSSLIDLFGKVFGTSGPGGAVAMILGVLLALILAGCVAGFFAYLIGLPVLRLKSDYLAIATLGFAEILRAIFQWQKLGPVTNGANMIKGFPTFSSFNLKDASGNVLLRLSTFIPFLLSSLCILLIVLLINSSYGRAFKSIRDDEIASEAMGISLSKHKMLAFVISSFFAGVGGGLFAMYVANAQAKAFTSTMTYEILLIVVVGGIGSVSGSVLATFLYVACSEWWLRFLDSEMVLKSGFKVPLLRNGFRMVVFSIVIMVIVLFFSQGIMGDRELNIGALFARKAKPGKKDEAEEQAKE